MIIVNFLKNKKGLKSFDILFNPLGLNFGIELFFRIV